MRLLPSKSRRAFCALLLSTALATTGCVDTDGPSLFVQGNATFDEECLIDPENPTLLLNGSFDTSAGAAYSVQPVFLNQLPNLSSAVGRTDPNWVLVQGAVVTLTEPGGGVIAFGGLPNPYTVNMSVAVPSAADSTNPGRQVGRVAVIPGNYAAALDGLIGTGGSQTVVIQLEFFGETVGETTVDATEYVWPITVCSGCFPRQCALSAANVCAPCQDGAPCTFLSRPICECLSDADCGTGSCNLGTCS